MAVQKKGKKNYRNLPGEEWRLVNGTEDYYISNKGRFRRGDKLYSINIDDSGYARCNIGHKKLRVHRLVAEAFIPNPDNLPVVDHIDNNKANNVVENLRWCTQQQNSQYAKDDGLVGSPTYSMVLAIDKDMNGILYSSMAEASRDTGVDKQSVYKVASGQEKSRGGYKFVRVKQILDKRYKYGKKKAEVL